MHMDNHHAIRYFENSYIFIKQYRFIWLLWFLAATLYNVDASLDIQRLRTPTAKGCDKPCNNGHCVNGTCVCQQGWGGLQCDHCFGRVRINGSNSGFFTDGLFNYTASARCTWIITSEQNSSLLLRLADFFTECCWDNLYIYDGDSAFDNLIGAFSGSLPPTEVVATSGKSIVYFTSDLAFNMMGFNITYQYNACPRNCSGRGNCVNGKCGCPSGYTGEACEVPFCANGVEATASPDGPCLNGGYCEDGKCNCNKDLFH
uniref:CUB domain-containing protein n=1 Tax=Acrobeloides nanus TaxID=290746 RepID=A0A914CJ52_9BILA